MSGAATTGREPGASRRWLWVGGGVVLAGIAIAAWALLPLEDWLRALTLWVRGFGVMGTVVFGLVFMTGIALMAPASILYMAAGLLYGLTWGFVAGWIGAVLGGMICFLIARHLARARFKAMFEQKPMFDALDAAVREAGWKVVLLLRLSPLVPGNVQNYAFGLTAVRIREFLPASAAGVIPWVLLFTWLGSMGSAILARGTDEALGGWQWAFMAGGVLGVTLVSWLVGRHARAKLAEMGFDAKGRERG